MDGTGQYKTVDMGASAVQTPDKYYIGIRSILGGLPSKNKNTNDQSGILEVLTLDRCSGFFRSMLLISPFLL